MDESPKIKVTDRRMFTASGELRDDAVEAEGSEDAEQPSASPLATPTRESTPAVAGASPPPPEPGPRAPAGEPASARPRESEGMAAGPAGDRVSFFDLVGLLAEPIALYLGDLTLPDGERSVDLEQARLYIDLLGVLQEKTRGNLSEEEEAVLGDLVYRLKMRYVQKRESG